MMFAMSNLNNNATQWSNLSEVDATQPEGHRDSIVDPSLATSRIHQSNLKDSKGFQYFPGF